MKRWDEEERERLAKVPPRTEITIKLDFLGRNVGRGRERGVFIFEARDGGRGQLTSKLPEKTRGEERVATRTGISILPLLVASYSARREGWKKRWKQLSCKQRDVVKGVAPRDRETRRNWRIDEISDIGGNLLPKILSFPFLRVYACTLED